MANIMMKKQSSLYLWSLESFSCAVFVMPGFRFSLEDSRDCFYPCEGARLKQ